MTALQNEVIDDEKWRLLSIDDAVVFDSLVIIHRHNLNSTDAALLVLLLNYRDETGATCVLVSSDLRFLRAANDEGLVTINPELLSANDAFEVLVCL